MNKKLNPLTENHLFTKAYSRGISDVSKLCAVYVLKNIKRTPDGGLVPTKFGISVNAKLGGAVRRSRVKRIIREGYRPLEPNVSDGLIIVVAARGAAFSKHAKSTGIKKALDTSFNNLGVYKGQILKKRDVTEKKTYTGNSNKKKK